MNTYIALLRGINVGGSRIVPMKVLARVLEGLGLRNVRTYIQSGNVVFQHAGANSSTLCARIGPALRTQFGFQPELIVLRADELRRVIAGNPFPKAASEPKTLHVTFLQSVPVKPDLKALEGLKKSNERFVLKDNTFYLHAPDGIGRSKVAARIEQSLGVSGSARNWRTVVQLQALADASETPA